jgi:hypothetical protein
VTQTLYTNQQIVTRSFQKLGIVAEGRAPSATQSANALQILNDNMLTQIVDGWRDIGWYPQTPTQLASASPLQDSDAGDIILCLASWLAPDYGRKIEPAQDPMDPTKLSNQIKWAFTRLNKRYLRRTECDLGELSRPQGGPLGGPNYFG